MIYVSQAQLDQVQYLIEQSALGNHILFDHETIRNVFANSSHLSEEESYQVEHHIEKLIELPTLAHKKAYLEKLDQTTYHRVVRTYFNIVENKLFESCEVKH